MYGGRRRGVRIAGLQPDELTIREIVYRIMGSEKMITFSDPLDSQIPELVSVFNAQVQNRGWSSMRAYHDQALINELQRRAVDVSAVSDGQTISFAHPVRYDLPDNKLIAIG